MGVYRGIQEMTSWEPCRGGGAGEETGTSMVNGSIPYTVGRHRDLISWRRCTPIHCLCNAYLGCTYPR